VGQPFITLVERYSADIETDASIRSKLANSQAGRVSYAEQMDGIPLV
jgi:hypothetical protein